MMRNHRLVRRSGALSCRLSIVIGFSEVFGVAVSPLLGGRWLRVACRLATFRLPFTICFAHMAMTSHIRP